MGRLRCRFRLPGRREQLGVRAVGVRAGHDQAGPVGRGDRCAGVLEAAFGLAPAYSQQRACGMALDDQLDVAGHRPGIELGDRRRRVGETVLRQERVREVYPDPRLVPVVVGVRDEVVGVASGALGAGRIARDVRREGGEHGHVEPDRTEL